MSVQNSWDAWQAALASTQPSPQAIPAAFDLVALGIARRFTLDTEPQRRAALQCAIVTAMQAATPQPFPAPAVQSGELPDALSHMSKYWEHQWHDGDQHLVRISREKLAEGIEAYARQAIAQTAPAVTGEADMVDLQDELWRAYAQNVISEMREIVTAGLTGEPFKAGFDSAIDEFEHRLLKTAAPSQGAKQNG